MNTKLRIAVWYNLPTGGARRALHDHLTGLVGRGHEVVCFRPPIPNPDWLPMPCLEREFPLSRINDEGNYFSRILHHVERLTIGVKAMQTHSRSVAKAIEKEPFDILFANTCYEYHAPFIGRYTSLPSVLYLQEPNRFLYEALPTLPWLGAPNGASWRRRLRAKFDIIALRNEANHELLNAKSYDRILVNSLYSRESVARAYGIDSQVCYLGVDTDLYSPGSEPREAFILGIGAIAVPKRIELAIRGVGALGSARRKLVWVANSIDQPYLANLREIADQVGVEFELRHLVPDHELVDLIRRAACVVYTPRLEPFGFVPLEAAACGAPVVTVAEGGLRETMTDGIGWIGEPTPEGIAKEIKEVLADVEAASRRVLANRPKIVERWNLDSAVDRLERHLIEVVAKRQDSSANGS